MADGQAFDPNKPYDVGQQAAAPAQQPQPAAQPAAAPAAQSAAQAQPAKPAVAFDPNKAYDVAAAPQPAASTPPPTDPKADEGRIHQLWDWANRGLVSKDAILDTLQRASATGKYEDVLKQGYKPKAHIPGFGDIDLNTLQEGVMDSTAGVLSSFTSPLSIALLGSGTAAKGLQTGATALRGAGAVKTAAALGAAAKTLPVVTRLSGLGIQASQIPNIIKGQQPGESPVDALERRLNAAGWTLLAAGEEGKTLNSDALHKPISELPESVRSDVARLNATIHNNLLAATDTALKYIGTTDNFNEAVKRSANMMNKKAADQYLTKINNVSEDLKAIINKNGDKIVDPKTMAQAIQGHLDELEQPLQQKAGATKDEHRPVVANFRDLLMQRIDKFFDDNRGEYGSPEEVANIKDRLLARLTSQHETGSGVKVDRDPNLYEAENMRRGLSKSSGDVFENGTSSGYRAASADLASFLRKVIDRAYDERGVGGVEEVRSKEHDLIDIRDALMDAQSRYAQQQAMPAVMKLFEKAKTAAVLGALGGHFLTGKVGAAIGLGDLWSKSYKERTYDIANNVNRAIQLAGREPNAQVTQTTDVPPVQGPVVPPPQGPVQGPTTPPTLGPVSEAMPPRPQPPKPAQAPKYNHKIAGKLSSYFGEFLGESPYDDLKQRFSDTVQDMKNDIQNKGGKYSQPQIDKAMRLQEFLNDQHAAEDERLQKENEKNAAKHQKDVAKWESDNAAALKAEKEQAAAAAEKVRQEAAAKEDERLSDDKIAHSPILKSLDPVQEIVGSGRTSQEYHNHEHGHIMAHVAEGNEPFQFISASHPDAIESNALAAIQTDVSDAMKEGGAKGIARRVVGILGGPAFDEVHGDLPLSKNGGARSDIARARKILREEGGLQGADLDKIFDALYDRAKEHVSNPEALALVRANAPLREAGLHENYHMSAGRMAEYVKKLKGAYNGNTPTTTGVREGAADGGVSEGEPAEAGAGGKEQNGPAEGIPSGEAREAGEGAEGKQEQSNVVKPPPKRSTGRPEVDEAIEKGGAIPGGVMKGDTSIGLPELTMFHDPTSGTTLALKSAEGVTPEKVAEKLKASRAEYAKYANKEQSNVEKSLSDKLAEKYGTSGDPLETGFILNDGRKVGIGSAEHENAIAGVEGREPAVGGARADNLVNAIDKENMIRVRSRSGRGGKEVVFSLPERVTPAQARQMSKAVNATERGSVFMERAGETAKWTGEGDRPPYARKEMATGADVPRMLRELNAHPLEQSNLSPDETHDELRDIQSEHQKGLGFKPVEHVKYNVDPRQNEMAEAYANSKHEPNNPAVKKSYDAMKRDIDRQYQMLTDRGYKIDATENDPYEGDTLGVEGNQSGADAAYNALRKDVLNNKHISVWKGGAPPADHPLSEVDPKTGLTYNEKFRAIHDIFGHVVPGNDFSANGEESAWGDHNQMFTPEARPALATETRGQTAYVTKHGNFADQRATILPEEFHRRPEGETNPLAEDKSMPGWWIESVAGDNKGTRTKGGEIARRMQDEGGFTVHPITGEFPKDGYMVESKDFSKTFDHPPTNADYRDYMREHAGDIKDNPALYMGGWRAPNGEYTLNLPERVADRDAAIDLGKKTNQISIYDLAKGQEIPTGGTGRYEQSNVVKGSSVPLMEEPLKVKGSGEEGKISTLDVAKALNAYSRKQHPALALGKAEPEAQVARAKEIAEDEAKYQLASGKTGTEWYTTEMKDHDDALKSVRPELDGGEPINAPTAWPHNPKLSLFKAAEAILSSGQKPYGNFKAAMKAWDIYNETGEFPRTQPGGKSWGPRGVAAYGNAMDMLNTLVKEKGEKGAAEWLLSEHPVSELKQYNTGVKGKKDDMAPGAMILGEKRGPFMQNLHGIESAFTADMWVTRTWNRWMGTMEPGINSISGEPEIQPSAPRNKTERDLMHQSFKQTADKLNLSTSALQAVLWYYEQALYSKQGIPKESWSFRDAARRAVSELPKEEEQGEFNFGENAKQKGFLAGLAGAKPKAAGAVTAGKFLEALGKK